MCIIDLLRGLQEFYQFTFNYAKNPSQKGEELSLFFVNPFLHKIRIFKTGYGQENVR